MSLWQGKRQEARGKSEEGLGDFTFLYTVWFYCVHLLNLDLMTIHNSYDLMFDVAPKPELIKPTFRTLNCHNRLLRNLLHEKGVKNYLCLKKNRFWIEKLLKCILNKEQ
ncbi:MAG: hypothetical protein HEQ13_26735 [Dolichospermum sp. DEX189]|nr:hypothetical protein [Dolichospermum sp. DEX189]